VRGETRWRAAANEKGEKKGHLFYIAELVDPYRTASVRYYTTLHYTSLYPRWRLCPRAMPG